MISKQVCVKCNESKELIKFHKDARIGTGFTNVCKECRNKHKRVTNISRTHRKDLLEEQENSCAICGVDAKDLDKQLAVDHNHETFSVRGLLCNQCNLGLGMFKDSVVLLAWATEYLQKHDDIT